MASSLFAAQGTERLYLSGRDKDDTVPWKFFCTSGANSGVWTNLPVPSQWDVKGFGTLTYKKDATNAWGERGLYEHDFAIPQKWSGKRVFLVFEGVMTDTSAKLNGESVGPAHQGSFYRFKYEVTKLAKFGATNRLEVDVARHSANESVNKAERLADFWVFAGIYRPVYLEAVPTEFIERVAIDAQADGALAMDVFVDGANAKDSVEAQVLTLDGKPVGKAFVGQPLTPALSPSEGERENGRARVEKVGREDSSGSPLTLTLSPEGERENGRARQGMTRINGNVSSPKQWTAETPNLYNVEVRLKREGKTLHTYTQRFGFRTFEVRDGDGLYLNGKKIILKGVNRHSFWPDSGRCLSEKVHRLDIETIKDMNGNAVRMSHYPPDVEFLDLCDELGLYVLDELAGWHNHYDNEVGPKLVEAMVTRDVNHPSILFWDNGNEGGFNKTLDPLFAKFDPQQRRVLHPWAVFSGLNTAHYLMYSNAAVAARGEPMQYDEKAKVEQVNINLPNHQIYLPTEFMHGLYDGGGGAGLADYWSMMMSQSNCAGGFIWAFVDESVKRPDTGELDSAGNQAPDGIVGPYREREGSFYAIKQLWSPIQVKRETNGTFAVENHYSFTDASECSFVASLEASSIGNTNTAWKSFPVKVTAQPGATVRTNIFSRGQMLDTASVTVRDPKGRELQTWKQRDAAAPLKRTLSLGEPRTATQLSSFGQQKQISQGNVTVTLDEEGRLIELTKEHSNISLTNGPRAIGGTLTNVSWRLENGGYLECSFTVISTGTNDAIGVLFDYPEKLVKSKRWLGDGPYRVWKNRLGGSTLGVWENDYNNTITGYRDWVYPEFKGFFANVRWLQLETTEGSITVVPENIPFVQVLTPEFPPTNLVGHAYATVPQCGLGFLHAIPPIGSKFKGPETTGPQGQPNIGQGEYSGTVSFYFGKIP